MRRIRTSGTAPAISQENFVPLQDAGVLDLRRTTTDVMPGVRVVRTGGHTMHHQIVLHRVGRHGRRSSPPT